MSLMCTLLLGATEENLDVSLRLSSPTPPAPTIFLALCTDLKAVLWIGVTVKQQNETEKKTEKKKK